MSSIGHNRLRAGHQAGDIAATVATWLGGLILFAPVFWMVLTSFKTEQDAVADPPKLFFVPTLAHYSEVFASGVLASALNSAIASIFSTLFVVILAVPAAYALSVRPVPKANTVHLTILMAALMLIGGFGLPFFRLRGKLLILRLMPRGRRWVRLDTTRSCRISASAASSRAALL